MMFFNLLNKLRVRRRKKKKKTFYDNENIVFFDVILIAGKVMKRVLKFDAKALIERSSPLAH